MKQSIPFQYDVVGSFLRSERLKEARENYQNGNISHEQLTKIEDEEIKKLVKKEEELGLKAVTDGEYRRSYWHLDFLEEIGGVERIAAEKWSVAFKGVQPKAATVKIVDRVHYQEHSFIKHFAYLNSIVSEGVVAKMTIPSPTMLHLICCVREAHYQPIAQYQNNEEQLLHDIAKAYQGYIQAFYDAGCRYLQLDDTSWGELCSIDKRSLYEGRGIDIEGLIQKYVALINESISQKPDDMTITMHICRGNFRSTWFSSGGYGPIAKELFGKCQVNGFFLEYDSERAGDFKPLKYIQNQKVVLGLITSKFPELEDEETVIERIQEASQYVPMKQLCISTQCGFASTEEGNILTEEEQWNKVKLVKRIAEKAL